MKTLSIKNPYAYLIAFGLKKTEYRSWKTDFRGRFLIHSTGEPMTFPADTKETTPLLYELCNNVKVENDKPVLKKESEIIYITNGGLIEVKDLSKYQKEDKIATYCAKKAIEQKTPCYAQAIIGSVELVNIIKNGDSYEWKLENPLIIKQPITEIKGRLKIWNFAIERFDSEFYNFNEEV